MGHRFPPNEYRLLTGLADFTEARPIPDLAESLSLDQSLVAAAAVSLQDQGLVALSEEAFLEVSLTDDGKAIADSGRPLIERRIAELLQGKEGPLAIPEVAAALQAEAAEVGKAMRFVLSKGYARKDKGALQFLPDADLLREMPDESLLKQLAGAALGMLMLAPPDLSDKEREAAVRDLKGRGLVKTKERARRSVSLTEAGRAAVVEGVEELREASALTEQMLLSGEWRDVSFRSYDIQLDTTPVYPAREHPLRKVLNEARQAFFNLGFKEVRGHFVESAFWDFDALFQPQDHPARDMQDTFYCKQPGTFSLPDDEIVDEVRRTHEHGGETGSTGWGYRWSPERARQVVLRTHTTAVTVSACHDNPQPPQKIFCVGRVFRRETIDYKHLPEFHQVEGIIVDKDGSLASLLGTLREFYRQMGFTDVKFRPDFFPYTEPSVGVFVRMPGRKDWFELGGSGIFRPEVTRPAGVAVPVLAWGLGLERLAMVRYGVTDIRELYQSHLGWLQEAALCR